MGIKRIATRPNSMISCPLCVFFLCSVAMGIPP
jgi:hypothetical protein